MELVKCYYNSEILNSFIFYKTKSKENIRTVDSYLIVCNGRDSANGTTNLEFSLTHHRSCIDLSESSLCLSGKHCGVRVDNLSLALGP